MMYHWCGAVTTRAASVFYLVSNGTRYRRSDIIQSEDRTCVKNRVLN
jgi:hypothetical protein